jgi:hypothetical protein
MDHVIHFNIFFVIDMLRLGKINLTGSMEFGSGWINVGAMFWLPDHLDTSKHQKFVMWDWCLDDHQNSSQV